MVIYRERFSFMRALLIIALWLSAQPGATITVSSPQIALGETVTYVITPTDTWLTVTLSEEMTITSTVPDCIMQPSYGAYCALNETGPITITARLDRLSCKPLRIDVVIADTTHVRGPDVTAAPLTCLYFPIIR